MKTEQRVMLTKRLLREALLRLLEKKPLEKITISELCREAGINRATFYRHYALPQDIIEEMKSELLQELLDKFRDSVSEKDVERFFGFFYENADQLKLFFKYSSEDDFVEAFKKMYARVNGERSLRFPDNEDGRLLYTFISGGCYFLLRTWILEDVQRTPKQIADIALSIVNTDNLFMR